MGGKTNRNKGFNAERLYASLFRQMGFKHCKTARYGSRIHDDSKIDLINIPINVQIKAGKQCGLSVPKVLFEMHEAIKKNFPKHVPERTNISIVIHHREGKQGIPRNDYDSIVSMTFNDFCKMFNECYGNNERERYEQQN